MKIKLFQSSEYRSTGPKVSEFLESGITVLDIQLSGDKRISCNGCIPGYSCTPQLKENS